MTVHYCTLRSTCGSLFEVIFVIFVLPIPGHVLLELFKLELPACAPKMIRAIFSIFYHLK